MPKHEREQNRGDAKLGEHASRASALLAARADGLKSANAKPSVVDTPRQVYPKNLGEFVKQNAIYIVAVAAVAVAVAIGIIALGAAGPTASDLNEATEEEPAYVSPFDWTKLDRDDGHYRYIVDGEVKSRLGVDVSENQHEIDWNAVAGDGIEFAMIRVGYRGATAGDLYLDEQYWTNMDGARNAGLDVGAYFFSQASTPEEAVEEADFVLEYLDGTPLQYPVAFDSEEAVLDLKKSRTTGLSNDEMTAIAEAFCERIESAGYSSAIYGNAADLSRYRYDNLEQNTIWWAEYGTPVPAAKIDFAYWQYSNSGQVDGIPTAVDMNLDLTHVLD